MSRGSSPIRPHMATTSPWVRTRRVRRERSSWVSEVGRHGDSSRCGSPRRLCEMSDLGAGGSAGLLWVGGMVRIVRILDGSATIICGFCLYLLQVIVAVMDRRERGGSGGAR